MLYRVDAAVYDEAMKLFGRQNANAPASEGSSPEQEELVRRDWRASSLRLLISAFVVVVVALAAAWALRTDRQPASHQKTPSKVATQGTKTPGTSKPKTSQPSSGSSSSPAPTAPAQTGNLTNTGPGDVASWFIAASITATGFYYLVILRRLSAQARD